MPWSLTFDDEGSGTFSHSLNPGPLRWEVVNFRGVDMVRLAVGSYLPCRSFLSLIPHRFTMHRATPNLRL